MFSDGVHCRMPRGSFPRKSAAPRPGSGRQTAGLPLRNPPQKLSFSANCMMRAATAVWVMYPSVGEGPVVFGLAN